MLQVDRRENDALWDVAIGDGRGNILDAKLVDELIELFEQAHQSPSVKVIGLRGRGRHFSFGASVSEHLPGEVEKMLSRFHELFRVMHRSRVVCLAAVRGQCLGGGMELASFCHRVFASPDAKLGQPEIVLGVFAPIASLFLVERVGRASAEDLCFTGRSVEATEALAIGLVDVVHDEPQDALLEYAREHLLTHSASSLRFAVGAARHHYGARLDAELRAVEKLYLEELMTTADANEGLRAFLDKRKPEWSNR